MYSIAILIISILVEGLCANKIWNNGIEYPHNVVNFKKHSSFERESALYEKMMLGFGLSTGSLQECLVQMVFEIKCDIKGQVERHKARLITKGYSRKINWNMMRLSL